MVPNLHAISVEEFEDSRMDASGISAPPLAANPDVIFPQQPIHFLDSMQGPIYMHAEHEVPSAPPGASTSRFAASGDTMQGDHALTVATQKHLKSTRQPAVLQIILASAAYLMRSCLTAHVLQHRVLSGCDVYTPASFNSCCQD